LTATGGGGGRAADPAVTAAAFAVGGTTLFYELRRLSNASALDRAGAARILAQVAHTGGPGFFVFVLLYSDNLIFVFPPVSRRDD